MPLAIPLDTLLEALAARNPGASVGPFNDFTDTLKAYGLFSPDQSNNNKRLQTLQQVLSLVLNGRLPPDIAAPMAFCQFLALLNDPGNPNKPRPIALGK